MPTAAAAYNCLLTGSLDANRYNWFFKRSERARRDTGWPSVLRMGNFPFLESRRMSLASVRVIPCRAVTKSMVITLERRGRVEELNVASCNNSDKLAT